MKRLTALIIALLLVAPTALAGGLPVGGGLKETPAPEAEAGSGDPREGYDEFADPADPASAWLLRMVDSANDEIALTADGAAICLDYTYTAADGSMGQHVTTYLYGTDYGYVFDIQVDSDEYAMHVYVFEDTAYATLDGETYFNAGGGFSSDYPATPDMFLYAYDPADALIAVRAEGDGFCYLTELADGLLRENETGADLVMTDYRVYEKTEAGDNVRTVVGSVSRCEAPGLPQGIIDLLGQ